MGKKKPVIAFESPEVRNPKLLEAALRNDGSLDRLLKKYTDEDADKIAFLCQELGIPPDGLMVYRLALALAYRLYPEPKKPGRRIKWTELQTSALVVEVERRVRPDDSTHGVRWACEQLSRQEPWRSFLQVAGKTGTDPTEVLRQRYFRHRKDNWANVMRRAYAIHQIEGDINGWEARVRDFVSRPDAPLFPEALEDLTLRIVKKYVPD